LKTFENFRKITAIKPLLIEGTSYATDQWVIIFKTTDDPELEARIPCYTFLWDNKVTTEWKSAPKVCFFCDKEGHLKKDCEQFKEAVELRQQYKKYQENKTKRVIEPLHNVLESSNMQNKLPNKATLRKENLAIQEYEVIAVIISQFNKESLAWASNQLDSEMDNNELPNQQEVSSNMDKENLVTPY
jgi:hypothetical protein